MKEEIFDFDKHKGRRIKVLIDCPLGGSVKKGEIGVLKYDNVADFPSQSGYSCGGGDNFYKRFELLPEDAVKEPQFEVGKWYRITDGKSKYIGKDIWYAKSIVVRDNVIIAGEYWHNYLDTNGNFGNVGDYTFTEVPLSEIQWFLPDGHSDKIVKEAQKVIKTDTSRVRVTASEIKVLKI